MRSECLGIIVIYAGAGIVAFLQLLHVILMDLGSVIM